MQTFCSMRNYNELNYEIAESLNTVRNDITTKQLLCQQVMEATEAIRAAAREQAEIRGITTSISPLLEYE